MTSKQAARQVISLQSNNSIFNTIDAIILGLHNLIQTIPKKKFNGLVRENDISCSYADAVLSPMFSNPDENKHLLW